MVYLYKAGCSGHEGEFYTEFEHDQKFTEEEFLEFIRDAFIDISSNLEDWDEIDLLRDFFLYDLAKAMEKFGFRKVEYTQMIDMYDFCSISEECPTEKQLEGLGNPKQTIWLHRELNKISDREAEHD